MNPNPRFKDTPLFDVEYLRNDTRLNCAITSDLQDHFSYFCLKITVA